MDNMMMIITDTLHIPKDCCKGNELNQRIQLENFL